MQQFRVFALWTCAFFLASLALAQAPAPASVPDDTVVAKVDGKNLTAGEVRAALVTMPPDFGKVYQQNPQLAIQQMYVMRYLAEEADKLKLADQSPLKEQLEVLRQNVLASAMLSHEHNFYAVSEEQIQEYYDRNQSKFQQSRVKALVVGFKPAMPGPGASLEEIAKASSEAAASKVDRTEADARALAESLVKQIRGGADFAKLVADQSDDPATKAAGGDIGIISVTSNHPAEFKNAVQTRKAGEVTDPIREPRGFYILRVEEKTAQSFKDAREPIRAELSQQHLNEWFGEIRKRFTPVVENVQFFGQSVQGQPARPPAPAVPAPK